MNNSPLSAPSGKTLTYLAGLSGVDSLEADNLSRHNHNSQPQKPRSLTQRLRVIWKKRRRDSARA
ncbi:hypothetical protein R50076_27660 [Gilvimarinus japonicus]